MPRRAVLDSDRGARAFRTRRRLAPLGLALALGAIALPGHAEPRCLDDAQVCLEVRDEGRTIAFVLANHEAAPYTARVLVPERHNLEPLTPLPFRAVLEPGEQKVVGVLVVRDLGAPRRYALRWSAAAGDARARHAAGVRYRMPFGGAQPRTLAQGVDGDVGHRGDARYAFDFAMPWGTPVLAARSGRVIRVVDGHATGGLRPELHDQGNRVELLHADGTIATYAQLRRGAVVELGQELATGERIGFSGDTGYSGGPHLHFGVWKREADLGSASVPVRFHDGSEQGFVPRVGVAYAPGCAQSGAGCAPGERPPAPETPAAPGDPALARAPRRDDGACLCSNGAVIHVDLPCDLVCAR